jgi:hypothetical protein
MRAAVKSVLIIAAVVVVVCVAAFAWVELAPRRVPPGQPPLSTLDARSLPSFRDAFNAADGQVRMVAMLSPT